jgi:mono/diheme cytochrome c family protein
MSENGAGDAGPRATTAERVEEFLRSLGVLTAVVVALLVLIWVWLPLLPEESGLSFGLWFRVFFTWILLAATAFFWMLGRERIPSPKSQGGALGSVGVVYLATVGLLVGVGAALPQFEGATEPVAAPVTAAERGDLLFHSRNPGCILCHVIDGSGGTRAPDLTEIASRAGARVAGLTAEQYVREKIKAGLTYQFTVPEFSPIMPPFRDILSDDQLDDLIAYLLSPR